MRPIYPQPGHTADEVSAALDSGEFVYADCYTIRPKNGDDMRYTTAQYAVSVVEFEDVVRKTYVADELLITGLRTKCNLGVEVDEQEIQIEYGLGHLFQNHIPWPKAVLFGRLDGAVVRRDRYIAKAWNAERTEWLGGFPMFMGLVASIDKVGLQSATIRVKSHLVTLNTQMPRDLFEANCRNTWGDTGCGVNQEDYAVIGATEGVPTRTVLPWSGASSEYALGKVLIANSDSTIRVRTISRADGDALYLSYPLDFDPPTGLAFTAYPGCDRTKDRCPFFHGVDWVKRFAGYPFVPVAETAIGG